MPNIPDKVDNAGQFLFAQTEWNPFKNSLQNTITDAGGTLVGNDEIQFRQAINSYASIANFYIDSGTATQYVLNPQGSFKAPVDAPTTWTGMLIRFRPTNTNTGVATLKLAGLNGGLAFNIVREDGTAIQAGDLSTTRDAILRYSQSLGAFILLNSNLYAQLNANTTNITANIQAQKPIIFSYVNTTTVNYSSGGFIFDDYSGSASIIAGTLNLTGLTANASWYIFGIYNPTTGASQVAHYDTLTPTLPAGFTKKKLLFAFRSNANSQVRVFTMDEDGLITYATPILDVNALNFTANGQTETTPLTVPNGLVCEVTLSAYSPQQKSFWFGRGDSTFVMTSDTQGNFGIRADGTPEEFVGQVNTRTDTSGQIRISSWNFALEAASPLTVYTQSYKIIS